uniref:Uncharacterized protein n=1 Tax=Lepeophtheirus salmonis TaxID=72036 RepID=A0A0K2V0X6_LEPSM
MVFTVELFCTVEIITTWLNQDLRSRNLGDQSSSSDHGHRRCAVRRQQNASLLLQGQQESQHERLLQRPQVLCFAMVEDHFPRGQLCINPRQTSRKVQHFFRENMASFWLYSSPDVNLLDLAGES